MSSTTNTSGRRETRKDRLLDHWFGDDASRGIGVIALLLLIGVGSVWFGWWGFALVILTIFSTIAAT